MKSGRSIREFSIVMISTVLALAVSGCSGSKDDSPSSTTRGSASEPGHRNTGSTSHRAGQPRAHPGTDQGSGGSGDVPPPGGGQRATGTLRAKLHVTFIAKPDSGAHKRSVSCPDRSGHDV